MAFCMNTPGETYVTTFPDNDVCRFPSFFENSPNNSDYQWGMAVWDGINNLLEVFGFLQQCWQRFYEYVNSQRIRITQSPET